jgi:hypothetical protein
MNRLEAIIEKEKEVSYSQEDKDIFGSHILILIYQEQESKKFKIKLCLGLFLGIGILSFSFSAINEVVNDFAVGLSNVMAGDFTTVAILSYGLSFVLLTLLKKTDFIFN